VRCKRAAVQADLAGRGGEVAGEEAQQCGLPGAVGADEGEHFARREVQRDAVQEEGGSGAVADGTGLKHQGLVHVGEGFHRQGAKDAKFAKGSFMIG
jgi:hypothetical protein